MDRDSSSGTVPSLFTAGISDYEAQARALVHDAEASGGATRRRIPRGRCTAQPHAGQRAQGGYFEEPLGNPQPGAQQVTSSMAIGVAATARFALLLA